MPDIIFWDIDQSQNLEENMPSTQENGNSAVCSICGRSSNILKRGENGKKYCMDCIQREHLIKCAYDGCNKYLKPDEIVLSGSGYLCNEHWNRVYTFCSKCGIITKKRYTYELEDGKSLCQHCFDETYYQCEDCGKVHPISEKIELEINGTKRIVCKRCREKNYTECSKCHTLVHRDSLNCITYRNKDSSKEEIYCCDDCIKKVAHRCGNCGSWFANDIPFHDEETCDKCYYQRGGIIHQYSYKPKIQPQKAAAENDDLLFGTELEIELKFGQREPIYTDSDNRRWSINTTGGDFEVDYKRYIAFKIDNAIPGFFYQKSDGSIEFGMEVVSHPATLEFWHSQEEKIENMFSFLRSEGCEGDAASTVGMHIHVTRNQMKRTHQNGFAAFVYSHKGKIEKLAGRKSNGYTKMIPIPNKIDDANEKDLERKILDNHDRYSAVNWNNRHTVELRMFQSTLDTHRFLANIEFSHALYHFSKEHTVLECINDTSWKSFCTFINDKEYYKFLKEMMTEKSLFETL